MEKGRRVYLEDLIEEYPGETPPKYASYHKDMLMNGPFTVIAAGKRKIVVRNLDGRREDHYCGDIGLQPYASGQWNPTNATFEMKEKAVWQDDWM